MLAHNEKFVEEKEQGFTLTELLIVLVIIGVLAAIAVPIYLSQRERAYEATMRSDLRTVAQEVESAYADDEAYPTVTSTGNQATITPASGTGVAVTLSLSTSVVSQTAGAAPGTFCLKATSTKTPTVLYYDSDRGGLQLKGTGCS